MDNAELYVTRRGLQTIRDAALTVAFESWSEAPPEDRAKHIGGSLLSGCCGAVSLMVQGCFGGEIIEGLVDGAPHFWNRLPDGREVDLTSCQFGGDGYNPVAVGNTVDRPELVDPRYLHFAALVFAKLDKDNALTNAGAEKE